MVLTHARDARRAVWSTMTFDVDGVMVALVPWPRDAARAEQLTRARRPRVLLVAQDTAPPSSRDELEDWVRMPADHREVEIRARRLARIASGGSHRDG